MMITRCRAAYDRLVTATARGQALAARASAWYLRLPLRRRELAQDTALAIVLAVLNLCSLLPYQSQMHPAWLALFLVSTQCAGLAIRRVNPVLALILCGIPRNLYDQLQFGYAPLPLASAIAFATVADRSRPWLRWVTIGATIAGIAYSQTLPGHTQPYDAIVQYFIFGTAYAVGVLNRVRRASLAAAADRAERAEAELDELAARAASAAAGERVRIARELHDVVAHHVSLMAVQAEAVGALLPERPEQASRSADLIAQTARQAMTELRRLLGVLRAPADAPDEPDSSERPGLTPAASLSRLDEVLAHVRGAGVPVSLTISGSPVALSPSVDLTAYRIVQEALTNTLRHAPPGTQACVDICYEDTSVTVRVTDTAQQPARAAASGPVPNGPVPNGPVPNGPVPNGRAPQPPSRGTGHVFSQPPARLGPGFGLAGIAERVSSCGGTLTVGPADSGGFSVAARLPVR
jgi:signal transduction histidine kinase